MGDEITCPRCKECGWFTLFKTLRGISARCQNCGYELAIGRPAAQCCEYHGRNCEPPSELCCELCTEARHFTWTARLGGRHYGHPDGEMCSNPDMPCSWCPDAATCGMAAKCLEPR
jgi:hypothetical protein